MSQLPLTEAEKIPGGVAGIIWILLGGVLRCHWTLEWKYELGIEHVSIVCRTVGFHPLIKDRNTLMTLCDRLPLPFVHKPYQYIKIG